uniref:NADH dehydrogenase subunit 6 n=1 Tax=Perula sp. 1 HFZ-2022c TaxID=2975148 RepID=UPI0021822F6D|nr:NADH dehydrogenase subunit 6 [Perula sp. 1 HFZ-2022c]UVN16543.1 NADH dehydrogenase subunit 6 [Perula sp. 1 HFZ-2022c]
MIKSFISFMLIIFSLNMLFLNHPLSMGLLILLQTILTCLYSGILTKTYWFSYILFLTFLGGLLVLFIYVSSIASNEMFNFFYNKFWILYFNISLFFLMMLMFMNLKFNFINFSTNLEMNNFFNLFFFNNENSINLSKLYNNQTFKLMIMMMIYLFITLIAIIKITNIFFGPLRNMN